MKNILYFLKKNKDKTFSELPFGEADSLLLCQLVYLNWEKYVHRFQDNKSSLNIEYFNEEGTFRQLSLNTYDYKNNIKLLTYLCNSKRYKDMSINELVYVMDYDNHEQFCAITYVFKDFIYICYRGTDISILGWKENFDMSFNKEIPSQRDAVFYLSNVIEKYHMKCYVGGHSKGGNLALYAAMNVNLNIKENIINVYTFDAPGFSYDAFSTYEFLSIKDKIISFVIKNSLVGVLMFYYNNITLIKTSGISIFQHDPFNWHITKSWNLKRAKRSTITSNVIGEATREFLKRTTEEERQKNVDILFEYLWTRPNLTTLDVAKHPITYIKDYKTNKMRISVEDKKELKSFLKLFFSCMKKSLKITFKLKKRK